MNVRGVMILLAVLSAGDAISAHHGAAAYDRSVTLTLKATVTEFVFKNPHIIISFDAPDDNGKIVHWSAEGGSSSGLARRGWTWKTLKAGDQVTVVGNPARGMEGKETRVMALTRVVLPNGEVVGQQTLTPASGEGAQK
jgi:uncharacterized protein DUF6152